MAGGGLMGEKDCTEDVTLGDIHTCEYRARILCKEFAIYSATLLYKLKGPNILR